MKNIILSFIFLTAISFTSCSNKSKNNTSTTTEISKDLAIKEISFGVRGNCGMCKTTIEKAANSLNGVSSGEIVANCHKVSQNKFKKELLSRMVNSYIAKKDLESV